MIIKLAVIDVDLIISPDAVKQTLKQTLSYGENLLQACDQFLKEIPFLKQAPNKPQFSGRQTNASFFLKKEKHWRTSSKKGSIEIGHDVYLPERYTSFCGSMEFTSLRTTTEKVEGLILKKNNTVFYGTKKMRFHSGKIDKPDIPTEFKRLSFDPYTLLLAGYRRINS